MQRSLPMSGILPCPVRRGLCAFRPGGFSPVVNLHMRERHGRPPCHFGNGQTGMALSGVKSVKVQSLSIEDGKRQAVT